MERAEARSAVAGSGIASVTQKQTATTRMAAGVPEIGDGAERRARDQARALHASLENLLEAACDT
jgi:hypothetical protein